MTAATDQESRDSGVNMNRARTKCPLYPTGKAMPVTGKASTPRSTYIAEGPAWSHPTAIEQTEARFRLSFSRFSQKRGPPSLFS